MKRSSKLLVLTLPLVLGVLFALSFIPNSNTLEIQNIELSEQERIDLELTNRGMVNIDGVWYAQDYLDQIVNLEKLRLEAEAKGEVFNMPFLLGGVAEVVHKDANGKIISKQVLHNRVVDTGETFIIEQIFKEGNAGETVDADQLATICVTAEVAFVDTSETLIATTFDTNDGLTSTNCISDASVSVASQVATIGALTFDAPTHVPGSTAITGIAICQGAAATPFNQCQDAQAGGSGILYAVVNIVDVTLETSETVDITYNGDFASAGS